jgi:hypothetical protein
MAIRPFLIAPTRHVFRALAPDRNAAAGAAPAADNHVRMRREIRVAEQPWWRGLAKKGIAEASELQT